MATGDGFVFICAEDKAKKMERVLLYAGGEITGIEKRVEGVVVTVRKRQSTADSAHGWPGMSVPTTDSFADKTEPK